VYGFVWVDVLVLRPWVRDHGALGDLYHPLQIARVLHLPVPTPRLATVVMIGVLVSAAVAATGRLPRVAGGATFALYLEWQLIAFSYGKVDHDRFGYLVALAVLPTVGRAGLRDERADTGAGWAVRSIQLAAVATYLLSVWAKARYGHGLTTWLDSTTLLRAVVRRGTSIGDAVSDVPGLLHVTQYLIVALELSSPLLLVPGRVGRWMLAAMAAFHAVTFACITIIFLPHCVCLLAFLPLERLGQLSSAWSTANRRRSPSDAPGTATLS
jgi:hypothetical protein